MGMDCYFSCDKCSAYLDINHGNLDRYPHEIGIFVAKHYWKCGGTFSITNDIDLDIDYLFGGYEARLCNRETIEQLIVTPEKYLEEVNLHIKAYEDRGI